MSSKSSSLTLQGKVAIVTGASRGIGAGLALELATRGAKVSFLSRKKEVELRGHSKPLKSGSHHIYLVRKRRARRGVDLENQGFEQRL